MTDQIFKADAKQLVDMLFDNKLFVERITRDDMASVEELLSFMMQSKYDSYVMARGLLDRIKGIYRWSTTEGNLDGFINKSK
jgi:hypothetical protein